MENLLNTEAVLQRFSISRSTLHRWTNNPDVNFPKPGYIMGRPYWRLKDIINFEERLFDNAA